MKLLGTEVSPKASGELELAQGALKTSDAHLFPKLSLSGDNVLW